MKFTAQVDSFVTRSTQLQAAVAKEAAQRTADIAQKSRAKGGKMPVDTGFLRNSFTAKIGGLPSGAGHAGQSWDDAQVMLTINNMQPGDTIYFGWAAEYAPMMENMYFFMRSAAMQWPTTVDEVVRELRSRYVR